MKRGINKVTLMGNVGDDPRVNEINENTKVARFPLATNEIYTDREGNQVHGGLGYTAHGINVAQSVGSSDLTKVIGVIDDGREKIHGLDKGQVFGYSINPGIIRPVQSYEDVLVRRKMQSAKGSIQVPWRKFGSSPRPFDFFRQPLTF